MINKMKDMKNSGFQSQSLSEVLCIFVAISLHFQHKWEFLFVKKLNLELLRCSQ